eukprot:TRINITY_DN170224_c0_g2_i2.p1 TRINITY_DN170224_c0_g2~~TRINITY_DN170224_c0_g2_i2.p1  ORF type:complete len:688 (+),score=128.15 TRINITY_DN170224_c0_g2_i2:89-2152(+)
MVINNRVKVKRKKLLVYQALIFGVILTILVVFSNARESKNLRVDLSTRNKPANETMIRRRLDDFPSDFILNAPTLPIKDPDEDDFEAVDCDCAPHHTQCFSLEYGCINRVGGECPPNYDECETRIFYNKATNKYMLWVHALIVVYMFCGLALVCDDYFVTALEEMCERWSLSEDVAGATFMAAGGSAPELFTSVIGVLIAENNVGFGTIVGSAVFNVLFVIAACAVFAGQVLELTWWPLFRDCTFYSFGLLVLVFFVSDQKIYWHEAALLLMCYCLYVIIMKYNFQLKSKIVSLKSWCTSGRKVSPEPLKLSMEMRGRTYSRANASTNAVVAMRDLRCVTLRGALGGKLEKMRAKLGNMKTELSQLIQNGVSKSAGEVELRKHRLSVFKAAANVVLHENLMKKTTPTEESMPTTPAEKDDKATPVRQLASPMHLEDIESNIDSKTPSPDGDKCPDTDEEESKNTESVADNNIVNVENNGDEDDDEGIFAWGDSFQSRLFWAILFPLNLSMWITIPNCTKPGRKKFFLFTFVGSLMWIAIFSYVMVWFASTIGYALGIDSAIMGLTILAGGTSIPDAISSVIVARNGFGDMAVSSSIGSNVFDINVGLPLPWLIKTAIIDPGGYIDLDNCGLLISVGTLLLMVLFVIISIIASGWKLNARLGWIMIVLYFLFVAQSLLVQYDVVSVGC